jgi:hypothetical protein
MTLYVAAFKFGNGCQLHRINARIHPVISVFPLLSTERSSTWRCRQVSTSDMPAVHSTFTRRTRGHHLGTLRIVTFSFSFLVIKFVTCYFRTPRINFFSFHPRFKITRIWYFPCVAEPQDNLHDRPASQAIAVASPFGFIYPFRLQRVESWKIRLQNVFISSRRTVTRLRAVSNYMIMSISSGFRRLNRGSLGFKMSLSALGGQLHVLQLSLTTR